MADFSSSGERYSLADEMKETGDIRANKDEDKAGGKVEVETEIENNSAPAEKTGSSSPVVEQIVTQNNSAPAEMSSDMTARELLGARKYRKAEESYHNLMDAIIWREIAQRFRDNDPEMLEVADNMQDYCSKYEDLSYSAIMERIGILKKLGLNFIERSAKLGLPYVDVRETSRLTDTQREQVVGLVMSGQHNGDEVKNLVKDLLDEIKSKDEAIEQKQSRLNEVENRAKNDIIEERYALESEKQDLESEIDRMRDDLEGRDEQLRKYEEAETAGGRQRIADEILRLLDEATRELQRLKYDPEDATQALENRMVQCVETARTLSHQINEKFSGVR